MPLSLIHPIIGYSLCIATFILLLGGCATPTTPNHSNLLASGLNHRPEVIQALSLNAEQRTQQWQEYLRQPLGLDQAAFIMLAHSPRIAAEMMQLGIADAKLHQAELIANPTFRIATLRPEEGGRWQLDVGLSLPLLDFFTRSLRKQMAEQAVVSTELQLHRQLHNEIANLQQAWYSAVAAQQSFSQQQRMFEATDTRYQLAASLHSAGNISEATLLVYENERQQHARQLTKQQTEAENEKLKLGYLMGLGVNENFSLPLKLPAPVAEIISRPALSADALNQRTDLKLLQQQEMILKTRRALIAKKYGIQNMAVGFAAEREFNGDVNIGPELEIELPLFDSGKAKFTTIDSQYKSTVATAIDLRLEIDKDIAIALNQYHQARAALQLIEQTDVLFAKRLQLLEREVNFMLNSPFELLKLKRQSIKLQQDKINALKNFWIARSELELAAGKAIPIASHDHHQHGEPAPSQMNHSEMHHSDHNQHQHNQKDSTHGEHHHD